MAWWSYTIPFMVLAIAVLLTLMLRTSARTHLDDAEARRDADALAAAWSAGRQGGGAGGSAGEERPAVPRTDVSPRS